MPSCKAYLLSVPSDFLAFLLGVLHVDSFHKES